MRGEGLALHITRPVEEDDLEELITRLTKILCLHHWRIKYKLEADSKMGKSLMQIKPNRDRSIAVIFIRESIIGMPTNEVVPLLLHEMLHLVIDPVIEEHSYQVQYEVEPHRLKEYQMRFLRPVEKVVEHLSTHLAPLIVMIGFYDDIETTVSETSSKLASLVNITDLCNSNVTQLDEILKVLKQLLVIEEHNAEEAELENPS